MDKAYEGVNEDGPQNPSQAEMLVALLDSMHQAETGDTVAMDEVLAELTTAADTLEQRLRRHRD